MSTPTIEAILNIFDISEKELSDIIVNSHSNMEIIASTGFIDFYRAPINLDTFLCEIDNIEENEEQLLFLEENNMYFMQSKKERTSFEIYSEDINLSIVKKSYINTYKSGKSLGKVNIKILEDNNLTSGDTLSIIEKPTPFLDGKSLRTTNGNTFKDIIGDKTFIHQILLEDLNIDNIDYDLAIISQIELLDNEGYNVAITDGYSILIKEAIPTKKTIFIEA